MAFLELSFCSSGAIMWKVLVMTELLRPAIVISGRGGRGGTRFQHPSKEKEMKGEDESKAENPLLTAIEDTLTENEAAEGTPKENECKSVANEDVSPDPVAGAEE